VGESALFSNLAAGLFILPFFLFSGMSGQLAEASEKSHLIRRIKLAEILIMLAGSMAIIWDSIPFMLGTVFIMGLQSTFFGPLKYSILPQHVNEQELTKANGLVEAGTFIAILLGTVLGTLFIENPNGKFIISGSIILFAILGAISAYFIPNAPANNIMQKVSLNPITSTKDVFSSLTQQTESVKKSVLGISWFWMIGAIILTALPTYVIKELGGDTIHVTVALVVFSLSIAIGSLLCEWLSRSRIELGLVPFGAFLISIFMYKLSTVPILIDTTLSWTVTALLNEPYFEALLWMGLVGIASGLYTVPLYSLIQKRTMPDSRARIIAANNILNALFMVGSAIFSIVLLTVFELSIAQTFGILAAMNLLIACYIYTKVPEFFLRFVVYLLTIILYRFKTHNTQHIPEEGAALITPNHVSFVDWMFLLAASPRPIRFVIFAPIYYSPFLNWLFRAANAIPIDSQKNNPEIYNKAFETIKLALDNGELVGIFPEGKLTDDGKVDTFKQGIDIILSSSNVPVIPVYLGGLWGSMFSRKHTLRTPRLKWSLVNVYIDKPIPYETANASCIEDKIKQMEAKYIN
jgi:1-acyl-sn-glycerol-3-phosphate acyltransferase